MTTLTVSSWDQAAKIDRRTLPHSEDRRKRQNRTRALRLLAGLHSPPDRAYFSDWTVIELLRVPNCGLSTINEIIDWMHEGGYWADREMISFDVQEAP